MLRESSDSWAPLALTVIGAALPVHLLAGCAGTHGAEIAVLTESDYGALAPAGKEVDAILGDYVLRNDRIVAVVAYPSPGRHANMYVTRVGFGLIDLTTREDPRDLLTVFRPGGDIFECERPEASAAAEGEELAAGDPAAGGILSGERVSLSCSAEVDSLRVTHAYELRTGEPFLTVTTTLTNPTADRRGTELGDALRAEGPSFGKVADGIVGLVWAYDRWFGQAYGVWGDGLKARVVSDERATVIRWIGPDEEFPMLEPGQTVRFTRRIMPAADTFAIRAVEAVLMGRSLRRIEIRTLDAGRRPAPFADVALVAGGELFAEGRTGADGRLEIVAPDGDSRVEGSWLGYPARSADVDTAEPGRDGGPSRLDLPCGPSGSVIGRITDGAGDPIPAKVRFVGLDGTPTPDFGPRVGAEAVGNLVYTPDGRFERLLPPGRYEVTASHGPEHDARTEIVAIEEGRAAKFEASLERSVETPGWVSADFHGHSTASGDTTASLRGRVLNLAAEHVEFAPSTEHNRLDTYGPEIEALGLRKFISTAVGVELTGTPFALNHQNAFPLLMKPRTQDNGAPRPDTDPAVQVRRLAEWDDTSEKLVQQNHPDLGWLLFDRDGDGETDEGHEGMLPYLDAFEIWGTNIFKMIPVIEREEGGGRISRQNNRVFNWLQIINQGIRMIGVANTDAHGTFHGSGGLRNFVKSSTDDPALIDPLEMVRNVKRGHVVMSNGPFLEVSLREAGRRPPAPRAIPGDTVTVPSGRVRLHVRAQSPNWFDIDRVYLILNGRLAEQLSFTRYNNSDRFSDGPVKFDQEMEFDLMEDTHIIVVALDRRSPLGPGMGPNWGRSSPTAISNPIFVDVDGGGFRGNMDTLGHPLPTRLDGTVEEPKLEDAK